MCLNLVGTAPIDLEPAPPCQHDWYPPDSDGKFEGWPERWFIPVARCRSCRIVVPLSLERRSY
jgi:hypothetical protein